MCVQWVSVCLCDCFNGCKWFITSHCFTLYCAIVYINNSMIFHSISKFIFASSWHHFVWNHWNIYLFHSANGTQKGSTFNKIFSLHFLFSLHLFFFSYQLKSLVLRHDWCDFFIFIYQMVNAYLLIILTFMVEHGGKAIPSVS